MRRRRDGIHSPKAQRSRWNDPLRAAPIILGDTPAKRYPGSRGFSAASGAPDPRGDMDRPARSRNRRSFARPRRRCNNVCGCPAAEEARTETR